MFKTVFLGNWMQGAEQKLGRKATNMGTCSHDAGALGWMLYLLSWLL